jgi:hypothetical protein
MGSAWGLPAYDEFVIAALKEKCWIIGTFMVVFFICDMMEVEVH